jgi:hypothetical protein
VRHIITRRLAGVAILAAVACLLGGCATPQSPGPADNRLAAPQSAADRTYLGLPAEVTSFQLEDIQCEVLVVDCFDMYCHICQLGAKRVNELYELAQARGLGERVKFIGLGVGDTPLEVATYKQKLKVPFPVFPDRRARLARSLGPLRVPNLLVLRRQGGRLKVIHSSPGELRNPADLLSRLQASLEARSGGWTDPLQAAQPTCAGRSRACPAAGLCRGAD